MGRPILRSVDSECAGRAIEPRNQYGRGGRRLGLGGRQHRRAAMAWRVRPRRGHRAGHVHVRAPQEPGRPGRLHPKAPAGNRQIPTPGPRAPRLRAWERTKAQGTWRRQAHDCQVPPLRFIPYLEGNEARREGRPGVGAPRSTREAGAEGQARSKVRPALTGVGGAKHPRPLHPGGVSRRTQSGA